MDPIRERLDQVLRQLALAEQAYHSDMERIEAEYDEVRDYRRRRFNDETAMLH